MLEITALRLRETLRFDYSVICNNQHCFQKKVKMTK